MHTAVWQKPTQRCKKIFLIKYSLVEDENGNVIDVTVTYNEGYAEQMLRYSKDYSSLDTYND